MQTAPAIAGAVGNRSQCYVLVGGTALDVDGDGTRIAVLRGGAVPHTVLVLGQTGRCWYSPGAEGGRGPASR